MTPSNVTPSDDDFDRQTRPFRSELLAHSYRMLGSVHDAEDAVQETYLRAWRGYEGFEGRSSIRTWLYRIATNVCLRALENRSRRALPTGLGGPGQDPAAELAQWPERPWLEPVPDTMLGRYACDAGDPLAAMTRRQSVRLAFIAALQHLAPRQRAVLVLREVLAFSAAEVAAMLDTTAAAVNSLLQRARSQIADVRPEEVAIHELHPGRERDLLDRFVAAMHAHDTRGLVAVLTEDAVYEMPPFPAWFRGAEVIGRMVGAQSPAEGPGDHLLVPTAANGQPAFGLYMPDEYGIHRAFNLQVLTVTPAGISHIVAFFALRVFARFGLPETATP
ncbi:sigma-70 family RNA polymerase sigma factor [Brevibacterium jeotgali]|uniref:RNA polymerase sigma-70 factor, ECF subfamily n=1 Tax=Brevibacterium jeotgali TaxID=1262550 RepID=A0A2H1L8B0_9MICO|nr:sigma-70 family RNA polymerase sigma factor [Brevibacterium jeotgali]TWC03363.1 RNA polymerase ECF family sigma subunit [Brevibacterium jeotgali]SMY13025.1 RNA polymerase sigma-70 factor, ECF subfamily [Brevibacterium jeotgali]